MFSNVIGSLFHNFEPIGPKALSSICDVLGITKRHCDVDRVSYGKVRTLRSTERYLGPSPWMHGLVDAEI